MNKPSGDVQKHFGLIEHDEAWRRGWEAAFEFMLKREYDQGLKRGIRQGVTLSRDLADEGVGLSREHDDADLSP
jgi:hypothetical protein